MCLPKFGFVAGVEVAPDMMFVEILVHNCFLIWSGVRSLANRGSIEGVGPSGDH